MQEEQLMKTPLYEKHIAWGGKMVPFAGWCMPVQYESGILEEHMAVRMHAGLFDVSHMGEFLLRGRKALEYLNLWLTNDYCSMSSGQARYSPMCNEEGGVIDDLIVYKMREEAYLMVVNASNTQKDFLWLQQHMNGGAELEDVSGQYAQTALQGPEAMTILKEVSHSEDIPQKYYTCCFERFIQGIPCHISRTGYTGEDGVEIYTAPEYAPALWELLLDKGKDRGLIPCGLGARDTLRMEAAMPLYGHEMDDTISPYEAGLGIFVKMDKEHFIGKEALAAHLPVRRKRVGLRVTGHGIIRERQTLYKGDKAVGMTTSGTFAPFLKRPVAIAIVETDFQHPHTILEADVRGRRIQAEVEPLPFYKRK